MLSDSQVSAGAPPPYASVVLSQTLQASEDTTNPSTGFSKTAPTKVEVIDPVKQANSSYGVGFVSYKVQTQTTLKDFAKSKFEVIRRFRDFAFLEAQLQEKYPGVIIPPLPDKNAVQKFKSDAQFIAERRRALQVFINRVVQHHELSVSPLVIQFLEWDEVKWNDMYDRESRALQAIEKKGKSVVTLLKNQAINLMHKKGDDSSEPAEYEEMKNYMLSLEQHLKDAYRRSADLVARETALAAALGEFGDSTVKLGRFEQGKLQEAFNSLGNHVQQVTSQHQGFSLVLNSNFEAPLKEYARYLGSVRHLFNKRAAQVSAWHAANAEVESKKNKLTQLRGQPSATIKAQEMERELVEAENKASDLKAKYDTTCSKMSGELARFQKDRANEMALVMREFAMTMAKMHNQAAKQWSSLVGELQCNNMQMK